MTSFAAARSGSAVFYFSITAAALLSWMLCHPYQGLFHDANLYSLQALARLYPESLTHDVFLSHGSQDRFTLFSPLYAAAISMLGIDRAAAALTLLSQLALLVAAFIVASQCLPRQAAAAGVVLLTAMPCDYGPGRIFACLEPFLTPRMLAEALTLMMLAAALRKRPVLATLLGLAAMVVHPVMALVGPAAIAIHLTIQRRLWARGSLPVALGLLLVAAGLAAELIGGRFDPEWLKLIESRSPYLFLSDWSFDDWTRAGVIAGTLLVGGLCLPVEIARLSRVVLFTMLAGWCITLIAADLLHLVVPTQMQAWRWQWLGSATSALLLPYLFYTLWRSGKRGRSVALTLGAAWIFRDDSYALVASLTALGLQLLPPLDERREALLLAGAVALMLLAVAWRTASNLEFTDVHYMDAALPLQLRRAMSFAKDGMLSAALVGGVLLLEWRGWTRPQWTLCLTLCAAAVLALPFCARAWASRSYADRLAAKFAPWRSLVPPQAEVLWNESPLGSWALLRRPHYISGVQSSGMVFSRDAALELEARAARLSSVIPARNFLQWSGINLTLSLPPDQVRALCALGAVEFLVTSADLGVPPLAELSAQDWPASHGLRLYRCSQ